MGSLLRQGTLAKDGIGSGGFLSLSFEELQSELACGSGKFLGSMNMVRARCTAPSHTVTHRSWARVCICISFVLWSRH